MKTLVLAAVAAAVGASQPQECRIVVHYTSDNPALATIEAPSTPECGKLPTMNIALAAAYKRSMGQGPNFIIGPVDNPPVLIPSK